MKFWIYLDKTATYPALHLYGTYYDNEGTPVAVEFVLNDNITIEVKLDRDDEYDEDLVIQDSAVAFIIKLYPAKWFKEIHSEDLENATRYNGKIYISNTFNTDLYLKIIDKIGKECHVEYESRDIFENEYHIEDD